MAKLKARGRQELVRVSKERQISDSELITWERTTITLMSDGKVLKKRDVMFKPILEGSSVGQKHSYGWKEYGKVKADVTPAVFLAAYVKVGYSQE